MIKEKVEEIKKRPFNLQPGEKVDFEKLGEPLTTVKVQYKANPDAKVTVERIEACAHRVEQGKPLDIYTGELIAIGVNKAGYWYICVRAQQRRDYAGDGSYKWAYRSLSEDKGTFISLERM